MPARTEFDQLTPMIAANPTGVAVKGCYAGALLDCGSTREREHFVSKGLLERLGESFEVYGAAWLQDGPRLMTPNNLYSNVLCDRHNRALSPYDEAICELFDVLEAWQNGGTVGWRTIKIGREHV